MTEGITFIINPGSKRENSVDSWRNYWKEYFAQNIWYQKAALPWNWIFGKEIRLIKMPEVNAQAALAVKAGIEDMIDAIGLDFKVNYYGEDPYGIAQIRQATAPDGRIDYNKLVDIVIAEPWRQPALGGKPHADVFVTDKYLADKQYNNSGDANWGMSEFSNGLCVIGLPGKRQNCLDYLRNIAKHEAGHLFGFQEHHDGSNSNVKGYASVRDCNMLWHVPAQNTCPKCLDAMKSFWEGVESAAGRSFLKQDDIFIIRVIK